MKLQSILICACLCFSLQGWCQSGDWYVQAGGGYLLIDQISQLGFEKQGPSVVAQFEIGRKFKPLSVGVQMNLASNYTFYKYDLRQHIRTLYAKYSLNALVPWLPYGLDPYLMVGASHLRTELITYQKDAIKERLVEYGEVQDKPMYSIGGGLQVGSHRYIFGLQYLYNPNKNTFSVDAEQDQLPFATSAHFVQATVSIRIHAPKLNGRGKCPRFSRKGIIRF